MTSAIDSAFQFLIDRHGFQRTDRDATVSYQSPNLTVTPSFNERDGFETHLEFPGRSRGKVAVGTILAALGRNSPAEPATQTAFLGSIIGKLTNAPPAIFEDLSALRFWHAPQWRNGWGKSIVMDASSIEAEQARLRRLTQYFSDTAE
jgi:hypothetical protein